MKLFTSSRQTEGRRLNVEEKGRRRNPLANEFVYDTTAPGYSRPAAERRGMKARAANFCPAMELALKRETLVAKKKIFPAVPCPRRVTCNEGKTRSEGLVLPGGFPRDSE